MSVVPGAWPYQNAGLSSVLYGPNSGSDGMPEIGLDGRTNGSTLSLRFVCLPLPLTSSFSSFSSSSSSSIFSLLLRSGIECSSSSPPNLPRLLGSSNGGLPLLSLASLIVRFGPDNTAVRICAMV